MPRGERILMGFYLFVAAAATFLALDFRLPEARSFPLLVGASTSVLIIGYFVVSSSEVLTQKMRPFIVDDLFMKIDGESAAKDADDDGRARQRKERQIIGMLAGFGLVAWVIGLTFAVPLFLLTTMRRYAGESWKTTLTVTAGCSLFLYVVFVAILRLKLHFGLFGQL